MKISADINRCVKNGRSAYNKMATSRSVNGGAHPGVGLFVGRFGSLSAGKMGRKPPLEVEITHNVNGRLGKCIYLSTVVPAW